MSRIAAGPAPVGPAAFASLFDPAFADLRPGATVLAAVSGGPDSIALMGALAAWSAATDRARIAVATVNHGLRPDSAAEAAGVAAAAAALGLPHRVLRWTGDRAGRVSQAAARTARYALLVAHARAIGAACLATAHTADDQAETILMRMAAGSGIAGLAGMAVRTRRGGVPHLRPLLSVPKAALVATCAAEGWRFVEDPSNRDSRYARTRWRALLPALAEEGLGADRLARLAARAARADAALTTVADELFARLATRRDGAVELDGAALSSAPAEIALRVLARALSAHAAPSGFPVRLERLEGCLAALVPAVGAGRALRRTLAGQVIACRADGRILISPEPPRRRGRPVQPTRDLHEAADRPRA